MNIKDYVRIKGCKSKKAIKIGSEFGRLTTIEDQESYKDKVPNKNGIINRHIFVMCRCECGVEKYIRRESLYNGDSTSCGCYQKEFSGRERKGTKGSRLKSNRKRCSGCLKSYKKDMYYINKHMVDGLANWCKSCQYYCKIKQKFNLTKDQLNDMLIKCNSSCEICKKELILMSGDSKLSPAIDHCHDSGNVRGILCKMCNWAINKNMTINILEKSKSYIKSEFIFDNKYYDQNYFDFTKIQINKFNTRYKCNKNMLNEIIVKQKCKCKLCNIKIDMKNFSLDHNHSNMKIRGLLCRDCNTSIGYLKENVHTIESAILYLKKHLRDL